MFNLLARSVSNWTGIAIIIVLWFVAAVVIFSISPSVEEVSTNELEEFLPKGVESLEAAQLEADKLSGIDGLAAVLLYRNPSGINEEDLVKLAEIDAILRSDAAPENIVLVVSQFGQTALPGMEAPAAGADATPPAAGPMLSPDGTAVTITAVVSGSPIEQEFRDTVVWLRELDVEVLVQEPAEVNVTGPAGIIFDGFNVFGSFDFRVTMITLVLVLAILFIIYRSPILAILPIVSVAIALIIAQSLAALITQQFDLALNAQVTAIMSIMMFGAGTDFTLFIVSRYREELAGGMERFEAIAETMRAIGPSLASSAATTAVALFVLIFALSGSLKTMGPMLAMSIVIMMFAGVTFVPAALVAMGRVALWPTKEDFGKVNESGLWGRVGNLVVRRPGTLVAVTVIALIIPAFGLLDIKPRYDLVSAFPEDIESNVGYQELLDAYPPGEVAPTNVILSQEGISIYNHLEAVEFLSETLYQHPKVEKVTSITRPIGEPLPVDISQVQQLMSAVPADPAEAMQLLATLPPEQAQLAGQLLAGARLVSPDLTTTKLEVQLTEDPYGTAAMDVIPDLRETVRATVAQTSLSGAIAVVGGETATATDTRAAGIRDFIIIGPIVIVAIWIILALLLGSVIAPTYLVLSVAVSFAGALGFSVLMFNYVFGHEGLAFSMIPLTFVFLIALGADYNIYIMSRIREENRVYGPSDGTRYAITRTGGVITSAGVILAGTFAVLTTLPLLDLFQLGFAVMVGILIDTFVVRALMVPAIAMKLGEFNWWPSKPTSSTLGH